MLQALTFHISFWCILQYLLLHVSLVTIKNFEVFKDVHMYSVSILYNIQIQNLLFEVEAESESCKWLDFIHCTYKPFSKKNLVGRQSFCLKNPCTIERGCLLGDSAFVSKQRKSRIGKSSNFCRLTDNPPTKVVDFRSLLGNDNANQIDDRP